MQILAALKDKEYADDRSEERASGSKMHRFRLPPVLCSRKLRRR